METFHDDNGSDLRSTKRTVNSYEEKGGVKRKVFFHAIGLHLFT